MSFSVQLSTAERRKCLLSFTSLATIALCNMSAQAQTQNGQDDEEDVIIVEGIRSSLQSAREEKRAADNLKEIIKSEDIGKLPDQNLADVLENITGVQLDRSVGVGNAVSIRGTGLNRVEINGNSTVGSDGARGGIGFEDLPASLIAAVEVTKVPEPKTIEGSVGGTINLRTFKGLSLKKPLLSFRGLGEYSSLSKTVKPRLSGSIGNRFETGLGPVGVIVSASYNKQDVSQFNARTDLTAQSVFNVDGNEVVAFRPAFLSQPNNNIEFENFSLTGSLEWKPRDELKLFLDGTVTTQERAQQGTSVVIQGIPGGLFSDANIDAVEAVVGTVDLGTVTTPDGEVDLGEQPIFQSGIINVFQAGNGNTDPNLRTQTNTNSRLTDTFLISGGGEWEQDRLKVRVEGLLTRSNSERPDTRTVLDFLNPNSPFEQIGGGPQDNGTPIFVDVSSGTALTFGIAEGLASSPPPGALLDPANFALNNFRQDLDLNENEELAFRADFAYDTTDIIPVFTSIEVGGRWNQNQSFASEARDSQSFVTLMGRPTADQFADIVIPGPDNFGRGDGRDLFISEFIVVDPDLSFNNPQAVIDVFNAFPQVTNFDGEPNVVQESFFDVEEETFAAYFQANYDTSFASLPIRGNIGVRWIDTELNSTGIALGAGGDTEILTTANYDFFLPRFSLVAAPTDSVLLRFGIARDISRPTFNQLSTTANFPGQADNPVTIGNPAVLPEDVWSFDVSGEYYFSDTGFFTIGFFYKDRNNVIVTEVDPTLGDPVTGAVQIAPPCNGGIFNPFTQRSSAALDQSDVGQCVDANLPINALSGFQTGVELAVQYDLADFEDSIGWASGFGLIGNFTWQTGELDDVFNPTTQNGNTLNEVINQVTGGLSADQNLQVLIPLEGISERAYNVTMFYEKYGVNFRARYSWRSPFTPSGASNFGIPRIVGARGQLNASLSYRISKRFTLQADGINLTQADRPQFGVNPGAILLRQGLTDRRITFGFRAKF